ncbi:MAG: hypothetical protein HQK51_11975 [Oligoflexia bacterium]|nr:hypothetical protein [Oligoflexia bacterium]
MKKIEIKNIINVVFACVFFLIILFANALSNVAANEFYAYSVKGHVFATKDNDVTELKVGDKIEDLSEISTEENAHITLITKEERSKFHLAGAGQVKLLNRIIELKRGQMWVQVTKEVATKNEYDGEGGDSGVKGSIHTANSITRYGKGEAILSYDHLTGKSQILVLSGKFVFSNLIQDDFRTKVDSGFFSFVAQDYNEGRPRPPTPIGYASYQKITSFFNDINMDRKNRNELLANIKKMENREEEKVTIGKIKTEKTPLTQARSIASIQTSTSASKITSAAAAVLSNKDENKIILIRRIKDRKLDLIWIN